jgi:hypothetical protein
MANVDRKWLPPALIVLAIGASALVFPSLPPMVDASIHGIFPTDALPAAPLMPRGVVAFGIPALALIIWSMFSVFRRPAGQRLGRTLFRSAPAEVTKADQFDRFGTTYETIVFGVVLVLVGLHTAVLSAALNAGGTATRILGISFGVSLVVMGNVMPRLRPNWVAGLRTKRTLEDPHLWRSAHRVFGTSLVISGVLTVLVAIAAPRYGFAFGLVGLIVSTVVGGAAASRRSISTPAVALLIAGLLCGWQSHDAGALARQSSAPAAGAHLRSQVLLEEVIHPMPRVSNDKAPIEVVEFAGIRHEGREIALPRLQQMIDEQHGVDVRDVDVGRPVQNQEWVLNLIDV